MSSDPEREPAGGSQLVSPPPTYWWRVRGDDFVLERCNDSAREISEGRIDSLLGCTAAQAFPDQPEIPDDLARCARQGGVVMRRELPYTRRFTREPRLLDLVYTFVPPDLVIIHGLDITDRQAAEAARRSARTTERRLRHLVSSERVMLWAADRDGIITEGKALEVFGLAPGAAVGRSIRDPIFAPDAAAQERIDRAYRGESVRTLREVNGRVFESEYFPERDEEGAITGITGLVVDVTHWRKAEEKLRATERRIRQLVDSVPLIVTTTDRAGVITLCEGHGLQALGLQPGERVGYSVLLPPVTERSIACFRRALAGETVSAIGHYGDRTFQNHFFPERSEAGEVTGVACLSLDVSERTEAEAALEATEKQLSRLMSNAAVILWAIDKDGVFTLSEGLGLAALGLKPGEAVGQQARVLYADVPAALDLVERVLAGDQLSTVMEVRGSVFEVHAFPDRDEHGEPSGASGLAIDISHQERALQELHASEERFRQFAENLKEGFWMATPDLSETVYSNPAYAEIFGQDPATFRATFEQWKRDVHPDDRDRMEQVVRDWRPERPTDDTYRIVQPDGSARWVRGRVFAIRGRDGRVTHVAGLMEDVTEARRLESEARRIRDHLADAQRIARAGNWEWDLATGELWGSEEIHRILGLPPDNQPIPFERLVAAVHAEDQAILEPALDASRSRGERLDATCRLQRPDGSERVVRIRGEATLGASGRPVRMIGTLQDVTESEEAEKAVAILSGAVEQTADIVFITDRQGRLEYVNPAFEAHTGYWRSEVVGETARILKSALSPPETFTQLWATILSGRTYRGVLANRKKNGEIFYEETAITPIRDSQGKITHFVSVGRDITARRQAEEVQQSLQAALRKSAEEWRATFDAVESPIVLAAPTGRVKRLNRAARDLWGEAYERILGRPLSAQPEEPWGTMQAAVEAVAQTHTSVSLPAESRDRTRTWGVSASPLPSSGGEPGVIVLAKDVSAIVHLQSSLRHNERMSAMGSLVAGVAHEVRNPLFGISSTLDAFEARFGRREEYEQYVAVLREQLERMTDFMRELLEYGKPAPLELAPGVLEDVIAQAAHACGALARRSNIKVVNNVKRVLPPVLMDRRRLVQVFQNLIDNAVRHSPSGATVAVEAEGLTTTDETWIECSVLDAGPGFRRDDLPQVFEPFFTRRRGGTGLGLSIVQRIVEEHGGSVIAENGPQGGALMRVRLPAVGVTTGGSA